MSMRAITLVLAAGVALALLACAETDEGGLVGTDALVVVQETNLGICSEPYFVERTVILACDGSKRTVLLCTEAPLCEAQVDDLIAPIVDCTEERTLYTGTTAVTCE